MYLATKSSLSNHSHILMPCPNASWQDFGIQYVMCSSIIKIHSQRVWSSSFVIPYCIPYDIFSSIRRKRGLTVSCLRKRRSSLRQVIRSMWFQYPQLRDVEWIEIDGYTVQKSRITNLLFYHSYREGSGHHRSATMACGACCRLYCRWWENFATKTMGFG